MDKKKILKGVLPKNLVKTYQKFKLLDYRIKTLEEQMKHSWLLDRIPEINNQKEIIKRKEFKIYSQTGEDGIINYIFEKIGTKNKVFVEIGIEHGEECNTANLSFNFGWSGLLIEANPDYAQKAKEYYKDKPIKVVQAFVDCDNINKIIKNNNFSGEIDLLSIDIDGNDYWIWNVIDVVKPRVVVIEYNAIFGKEPISIKYSPAFERFKGHKSGFYYGASLTALKKLAEKKGYILIGSNSLGFNAFFIRKKEAKGKFRPIAPEGILDNLPNRKILLHKFSKIKDMEFVEV